MAKIGAEKMALQAILNVKGDSSAFVADSDLCRVTGIAPGDMRNYLLMLDQEEYIDLALTSNGFSASITPKGRLALRLYAPPVEPGTSRPLVSSKSRSRTGRERALVIGISDYPPPIPKLPAVANDVREIAQILSSDRGEFPAQNVSHLMDGEAIRDKVIESLKFTFQNVQPDDSVFVYMAGHGAVVKDEYFFVAFDTEAERLNATGIPLTQIRGLFEQCPSQRVFLWLDFCHCGGILARDLQGSPDDRAVIARTLKVVQGTGKLILAACSPEQSAWESNEVGHGLFTDALLRGLKGEAAYAGEVTVNSLFDYIDRTMGSDRQRPMLFGQMLGRLVLTH